MEGEEERESSRARSITLVTPRATSPARAVRSDDILVVFPRQ